MRARWAAELSLSRLAPITELRLTRVPYFLPCGTAWLAAQFARSDDFVSLSVLSLVSLVPLVSVVTRVPLVLDLHSGAWRLLTAALLVVTQLSIPLPLFLIPQLSVSLLSVSHVSVPLLPLLNRSRPLRPRIPVHRKHGLRLAPGSVFVPIPFLDGRGPPFISTFAGREPPSLILIPQCVKVVRIRRLDTEPAQSAKFVQLGG